jgi:hypothetical protein
MASTFLEVAKSIPGLTHFYALDATNKAKDLVGGLDGQVQGNVAFNGDKATFDGKSWVKVPADEDFSAATTGEITVVAFMQVTTWSKQSNNNEYVHWMGKGSDGKHEWTCRYYIDGGGGEAPERKRRTSFYAFNPEGGLGAGSYVQDESASNSERMMAGAISVKNGSSYQFQNAVQKDKDALADYDIKPEYTSAPVGIGSRGDNTGFLVGTIRRVAFYNRLLSADEQKKLYDARSLPATGGDDGGTDPEEPDPGDDTATQVAAQLRIKSDELTKIAADLDSYADQLDS